MSAQGSQIQRLIAEPPPHTAPRSIRSLLCHGEACNRLLFVRCGSIDLHHQHRSPQAYTHRVTTHPSGIVLPWTPFGSSCTHLVFADKHTLVTTRHALLVMLTPSVRRQTFTRRVTTRHALLVMLTPSIRRQTYTRRVTARHAYTSRDSKQQGILRGDLDVTRATPEFKAGEKSVPPYATTPAISLQGNI